MIENDRQPVVMTIAGFDPSAGAGILADIKTISAFGCYGVAAITSLTFQNTQGVFGAEHQRPDVVRSQIEPLFDDFEIAAIKTGMLPTAEIIEEVASIISSSAVPHIVVDPVIRSTSGHDLIDEKALDASDQKAIPARFSRDSERSGGRTHYEYCDQRFVVNAESSRSYFCSGHAFSAGQRRRP